MTRNILSSSLLVLIVLSLPGCGSLQIGVSDQEVNSELFNGDPAVFNERIGLLKEANAKAEKEGKHLHPHEVWEILKVREKENIRNVETLGREGARFYVYGNTAFNDLNEADEMRKRMDRTRVQRVRFMLLKTRGALKAPFHVKYNEVGYDLRLILVFENGDSLTQVFVEGTSDVNTTRSVIIFNPLTFSLPSITSPNNNTGR